MPTLNTCDTEAAHGPRIHVCSPCRPWDLSNAWNHEAGICRKPLKVRYGYLKYKASSDPAATAFSRAESGSYHQCHVTPPVQTTPPAILCKAAVKQLSRVKSTCRRGWNSLPKHSSQHIHLSVNAGVYRLKEKNRIKGKCLPAMDLGSFLHSPCNISQVLLIMEMKLIFQNVFHLLFSSTF